MRILYDSMRCVCAQLGWFFVFWLANSQFWNPKMCHLFNSIQCVVHCSFLNCFSSWKNPVHIWPLLKYNLIKLNGQPKTNRCIICSDIKQILCLLWKKSEYSSLYVVRTCSSYWLTKGFIPCLIIICY